MRIVFMGCVQFSYKTLKHLLSLEDSQAEVVGIVTRKASDINADFQSLIPIVKEENIPCFIAEDNDQDAMFQWLNKIPADVFYCFGWPYLLNEKILKLTRLGVIGYHPASLPKNRGRHPIIWALALGLKETHSTFFFMNHEADAGDILSQRFLKIDQKDTAEILYEKLIQCALMQISEFTPKLVSGDYQRITQDDTQSNYWRKRTKDDGWIDWRMSAESIYNLVRALSKPYPGAHFLYKGQEIKVWKTEIIDENCSLSNLEPGKIVDAVDQVITVKCGDGLLKLVDYECSCLLKKGEYL